MWDFIYAQIVSLEGYRWLDIFYSLMKSSKPSKNPKYNLLIDSDDIYNLFACVSYT